MKLLDNPARMLQYVTTLTGYKSLKYTMARKEASTWAFGHTDKALWEAEHLRLGHGASIAIQAYVSRSQKAKMAGEFSHKLREDREIEEDEPAETNDLLVEAENTILETCAKKKRRGKIRKELDDISSDMANEERSLALMVTHLDRIKMIQFFIDNHLHVLKSSTACEMFYQALDSEDTGQGTINFRPVVLGIAEIAADIDKCQRNCSLQTTKELEWRVFQIMIIFTNFNSLLRNGTTNPFVNHLMEKDINSECLAKLSADAKEKVTKYVNEFFQEHDNGNGTERDETGGEQQEATGDERWHKRQQK